MRASPETGKVRRVRVGSPATTRCEPRQARKGAAAAARSGAGVGLTRIFFWQGSRRELHRSSSQMAAEALRDTRWSGRRRQGAG